MKKTNILKRSIFVVLLISIMMSMAGCYDTVVQQNSVGIEYSEGVMTGLKSPGRHRSNDMKLTLEIYDGNTNSATWTNSDIWTSDKQKIELAITVHYARNTQEESVKKMLRLYSTAAKDDFSLQALVLSKVPETVKNVTTTYKIDNMVGLGDDRSKNRETFKADIMEPLAVALELCGIDLIDLQIDNIQPSAEYETEMQQKSLLLLKQETLEQQKLLDEAQAKAQIDKNMNQIAVLQAQQELEKAQTDLEVEKARRENLIAAEKAKTLDLSPAAFELERLEKLAKIYGPADKWFFVQPGVDLNFIVNGEDGTIIPASE